MLLVRCALEWLYLLAVNDGWVVYVGTLWMVGAIIYVIVL